MTQAAAPQSTARVEKTIAAPADRIWEALTTPRFLKRYFMGADIEADWKVGGPSSTRWWGFTEDCHPGRSEA